MNRVILAAAISAAFAGSTSTASADGNLIIYSGDFNSVAQSEGQPGGPGFALVERRVAFTLPAGEDEASLTGLPRALDASSVLLKPRGSARVRGQRFDFAIGGQQELLRRTLGQSITVEMSVGNERQTHTGTLIAAGPGLTLRMPDGRIKILSEYSSFELPRLPGGVVGEPTLIWSLSSPSAGRQEFDLNYATAGLAWRAEYNVNARGQGRDCRLSLDGAAMVVNRSGADFDAVMLTLVAGEPNRVQSAGPQMDRKFAGADRAQVMSADSAPAPQASGEYQAYKLPTPGSLPQGSVQRLPLVNFVEGVACERRYETTSEFSDWRPPHPIIDENFAGGGEGQPQPVNATLRFRNAKADGLGVPLPAGRVRMFDGADFLGEASLAHTPANQDIALTIGSVFDLTAKRSREDFKLDRDGRTITETVTVLLGNAKPSAVTVRVNEQLARWTDWEIVSSTVPFDKRSAQKVSFDVPVKAEGETRFTYTVRYRWAEDVKLP